MQPPGSIYVYKIYAGANAKITVQYICTMYILHALHIAYYVYCTNKTMIQIDYYLLFNICDVAYVNLFFEACKYIHMTYLYTFYQDLRLYVFQTAAWAGKCKFFLIGNFVHLN